MKPHDMSHNVTLGMVVPVAFCILGGIIRDVIVSHLRRKVCALGAVLLSAVQELLCKGLSLGGAA